MELTEQLQAELGKFLDHEGRITQFPSKHRNKFLVLLYLSKKFEADRIYTEKEINEIIEEYHSFGNKWMLRRELIDRGFLNRLKDGSQYWLAKEQPSIPL